MRFLVLVVVHSVTLFTAFYLGVDFGKALTLRSRSSVQVRRDPVCTCVPCLPDLYCVKCGHKSRDCPRLASHFSKTNDVSKLLKRGD